MTDGMLEKPSEIRLSEHFLLSDFLGCDSVYRKGLVNNFVGDSSHITEGEALCENVLEPLLKKSRLSISYGYISPDLSEQIVKCRDPRAPAYHRWDDGAACDVVLHESGAAPIKAAFWADANLPMSRTITYSESPCICLGVKSSEIAAGKPRRALYENRYMGERLPQYVRYSTNFESRAAQRKAHTLEHPWEGAGYPTYHGGGRRQLHHHRTSRYTILSDFLFSETAIREGHKNFPLRNLDRFYAAGDAYDAILETLGIRRMSIVRGYESSSWSSSRFTWKDCASFVVVPPASIPVENVLLAAGDINGLEGTLVGDRKVAIRLIF